MENLQFSSSNWRAYRLNFIVTLNVLLTHDLMHGATVLSHITQYMSSRVIAFDEHSFNRKKTSISLIVHPDFPTFRLLQLHFGFLIYLQKVYKLNSSCIKRAGIVSYFFLSPEKIVFVIR